jgi:AbrB family looped-hinge helix DNA binding protein
MWADVTNVGIMTGMTDKDRPMYLVTVEDRGRLVLPAELRRRARLERGERMAVQAEEDGSLRLERLVDRIERLTGSQAHLGPGLVDELLAERAAEARRENEEGGASSPRVALRGSSKVVAKRPRRVAVKGKRVAAKSAAKSAAKRAASAKRSR